MNPVRAPVSSDPDAAGDGAGEGLAALAPADLRDEVMRLRRARRLQQALYDIANLAVDSISTAQLLGRIHAIVGQLMYARNFYVVLHDAERDTMRFLYFADDCDSPPVDPDEEIPASCLSQSITLTMMRSGRAAMGPPSKLREELGLRADQEMGTTSLDWLGVPMADAGGVRGRWWCRITNSPTAMTIRTAISSRSWRSRCSPRCRGSSRIRSWSGASPIAPAR